MQFLNWDAVLNWDVLYLALLLLLLSPCGTSIIVSSRSKSGFTITTSIGESCRGGVCWGKIVGGGGCWGKIRGSGAGGDVCSL